MDYPFDSLWINGRPVVVEGIRHQTEIPRSDFERNTIDFIRYWLEGTETFPLQTSGSTGPPKNLSVHRSQLEASARLTGEALEIPPGGRALLCLDPRFIGGKMMIVRSFVRGLKLTAVEPSGNPLEYLPSDGGTFQLAAMVPLQVHTILGSKHPQNLDRIEKLLIGGAPLEEETILQLQNRACICFATYGMTETISHIALRQVNGPGKQSHFHALPGIVIRTDARGCLLIRAPFLDNEVVTNDIVEMAGEGSFRWIGRWDNVINTGGIKINPEKIEPIIDAVMKQLFLPNRFFIGSLPDARLGQKIVLVVEGVEFSSEIQQHLLQKLSTHLSSYEIPKAFLFIPAFVTTGSGKLNRMQSLQSASVHLSRKK